MTPRDASARRSPATGSLVARNSASTADEAWPPLRVLCVDDRRDCADSAAMLLRVMGFEARACYDGETALSLNESFRPGICFLDLNMPGMDGDEVASRLRASPAWHPPPSDGRGAL